MTKINEKKGFTLIELMVVMAIIAVLAVLMIGAIQLARSTATETTHRSNAKTLQTALESNFAKYKMYCGGSTGIACAATDFTTASTNLSGITLGTASSACPANEAGGGRITTLTGTSYVLAPANSSCTAFTDLSDVLYTGVAKPAALPGWVTP
jgi:prepilin-type N-terminal cleavage/methylation domain-containing protein